MYDLFISYHRADSARVVEIRNILKNSGLNVFLDKDGLSAGLPWPKALENALGDSKALAAFIGAEIGPWQSREIGFALDRQAEAEKKKEKPFPVIPVLLKECQDLSVVPGFLRLNTWVDLRSEPPYDQEQLQALRDAVNGGTQGQKTLTPAEFSPYRGLYEFREQDAAFFFGREAFSQRLFEAVDKSQLVCLIGNSGSGKSSVAKAGLVPLLRKQRPPRKTWDALFARPTHTPFDSLAMALAPILFPNMKGNDLLTERNELQERLTSGRIPLWLAAKNAFELSNGTDRLLLVIDQFEELFTLVQSSVRAAFIANLLEALEKTDLRVLMIVRADFYGRLIGESRALSDRVEQGVVNVGSMTPAELRLTIEKPAEMVGLAFEEGLVDRILDDAGNEPGSLPLVEFALDELTKPGRRRGNVLTNAGYSAIGEVAASIAKRADQVFDDLKDQQKDVAPGVFRRLVRVAPPGEGGQDTRQIADVTDLGDPEHAVIEAFVTARLLVTGRDANTGRELAQVAHEALIRKWTKLAGWLNQQKQFLLWRQRINQRIQEWESCKRDEGALLYKVLLAEARLWREQCAAEVSKQELEYIQASEDWESRSSQVESQVLGLRLASEARRILGDEPAGLERSMLLAIEALRRNPAPQVYEAFMQIFELLPRRLKTIQVDAPLVDADFTPDGKWIVTASENGEIRIFEGATYSEVRRHSLGVSPGGLVFSTDSEYVGLAIKESDFLVLDLVSGQVAAHVTHSGPEAPPMRTGPGTPAGAFDDMDEYTEGGRLLAFGAGGFATAISKIRTVTLWALPGGRHLKSLDCEQGASRLASGPKNSFTIGLRNGAVLAFPGSQRIMEVKGRVKTLTFSPDERFCVMGSSNEMKITDATGGTISPRPQRDVRQVAFSSDGSVLATLDPDGILVRRIESGEELARIKIPYAIESIVFGSSGRRLFAKLNDGTARMFSVPGGVEVARMTHNADLVSARFGPIEDVRLTASKDGVVSLWRSSWNGVEGRFEKQGNSLPFSFRNLAFGVDAHGRVLASFVSGEGLMVWNLDAPDRPKRMELKGYAMKPNLAVSPSGKLIAIKRDDDVLMVDTDALRVVHTLTHPPPAPSPDSFPAKVDVASFSPDGRWTATSHGESTRVWNSETGDLALERLHKVFRTAFAFSPDAKLFACQTGTIQVVICEIESGREVATFEATLTTKFLAFTDNSERLVVADTSGVVRLLKVNSGTEDWKIEMAKEIHSIAVVPGMGMLATACRDGAVVLWSLEDGSSRHQLEHITPGEAAKNNYKNEIRVVPVPRRGFLASFSLNPNRLRIFDLRTGAELCRFRREGIEDFAFSPDGRLLYVTNGIDVVEALLWHPDELIAAATSMLSRQLTPEERSRYAL